MEGKKKEKGKETKKERQTLPSSLSRTIVGDGGVGGRGGRGGEGGIWHGLSHRLNSSAPINFSLPIKNL